MSIHEVTYETFYFQSKYVLVLINPTLTSELLYVTNFNKMKKKKNPNMETSTPNNELKIREDRDARDIIEILSL